MQVKDLQLKRVLRTALLVLLLGAVGMTKGYAYDFSAVCSTGQTLYYDSFIDYDNGYYYHYARVVCPGTYSNPWGGFVKPTGYMVIPDSVVYNGHSYAVISIKPYAFYGCSGLTGSLTIPNSIYSIGEYAFYGCSGFDGSLTIPNSVTSIGSYAFSGCSGFTGSLTFPNSLFSMGEYIFSGCRGFTSLILPEYNNNFFLNKGLFQGCSGFTGSLTLPNSLTWIRESAFEGCSGFTGSLTISNVISIEYRAFYGCSGLTDLTIGNSVTSIGSSAFYGCSGLTGSLAIPNSVTSIGSSAFYGCSGFDGSLTIGNSVTSIGSSAFYGCSGLTGSLTIPNSVTTIGERAFYGCSGLTGSLTIPNSVTTIGERSFYGCSGFDGFLTIPNSVTSIGSSTFSGCSGLTGSLTIPNSVTSIGQYAFQNCSGLTGSLTIPNSVTSIGQYAFYGCSGFDGSLTIPNSVTSIGQYAFQNCSGLTGSLTIPNSVTSIGQYAFYGCSGFDGSLTIPNSVTSIGSSTFSGCSGLTGFLTIPNSVTSIGGYAFQNCSGLTGSLTIPNSVTSIGSFTFSGCSGLTGFLTIPNSVTSIGNDAFSGCSGFDGSLMIPNSVTSIGKYAFSGCSGLTGLTIGDSVTTIGNQAFNNCTGLTTVYWNAVSVTSYPTSTSYHPFKNCTNLTTVVFGDQVQTIPAYAFQNCSGLTGSLTIPNSVTSIGQYAFQNCSGLTGSLTVPNSVTTIRQYTFSGCSGFDGSLTIPNSVTSIGNYAFSGCSGFTGSLTIPNSVTSIGNRAFSNCSFDGLNIDMIEIPNSFISPRFTAEMLTGSLTIGNSVTSIGNSAFSGCSGLTGSLAIPNSVTSIGSSAFYGCSGFDGSLTIGNSVTSIGSSAFSGCSGLTGSLTIPNSVTSIGQYAFQNCSGLTGLTIGDSVTTIGNQAFNNCTSLITVYWNAENVTSYPTNSLYNPFSNCTNLTTIVFGDQVQTIPAYAFYGRSGLTGSLTIPNSVTSIGGYAFYGCSGLTTVNWNAVDVTNYPSWGSAFMNCSSLTTVVFGNQVQRIPAYAFYGCSGFTGSLTIPNSVTSIGQSAFSGCSGLEAVYYTGNIAQWCNISFASDYSNPLFYAHHLYIDDELVTDLVIPETVTEIKDYVFVGGNDFTGSLTIPNSVISIGEDAFYGCSGFDGSLTIPNSVTSIGNLAFYGCSGLTGSLTIPNSVTSIGSSAFAGCSGLTGLLTIGSSVTSIGNYAFSNCSGINAIRMQCAPPAIYDNTFADVDKTIPVFVPCGTQEDYATADYWSEFEAISESPYNLIVTQNDPLGGEVSVVHYADCDDNHCAILAINNIGYNFVGWFVNDYFSTDLPYCDFSLIDNVTFEARFERRPNHFITIVTSTSNIWSDSDTWDTGEVPSSTSTVAVYKDIIVDVDAEVSELGVYEDNSITISPDVTLTVTDTLGSDNVASIAIEDGGQLIHSSDGAMATVKKTIQPYTNDNDGWNLLSYPLTGNGTVASIGNMLNNEYDLYAYDEPTQYWINQKEESNGFTALEAGQGYLYANKGTGMGLVAGSRIGEGASSIGYTPFYTYYENSIAENLFLASELETASLPTTALGSLCWYATNQTGYLQSNISIWMANVIDEVLTTTSHNVSNMTLVYTGSMTPVAGWNAFVFNESSFAWDGTSNVLICVQRNNGAWNSEINWQAHNPGFVATSYQYRDGSAYDMTSGTYSMNVSSTLRPNIIFQTLEQVGEYEYYEPITMSFAGEMENGAAMVNVPLSFTESAGNLKGFNLVGNPFVHNVTTYAGTNVAEGCFRLNEVKDNLIVSEVSETLPLKPAEGFFVKATDVGASITFNPDRSRSETDRKGFVNLELRENDKLIDRLIVKREGEPLEKLMLKGNGTRLYAMQDRQEMAIVPCEGNEQAVCFKAAKNGSYTINVSIDSLKVDYLHLIDNLTGNDIDLLVTPSYTFEAKTNDYASRFRLVFVCGDANDDNEGENEASFAYICNGDIMITADAYNASLQVIDVMGRVLVCRDAPSASVISTAGMAPGVYMLRLINGDNMKVQKIIVR